jgi:Trk-type K+ transport system membrane component
MTEGKNKEKIKPPGYEMTEGKNSLIHIVLFGILLSGAITFIVVSISFFAWIFLQDPLLFREGTTYVPSRGFVKMLCYITSMLVFFVYVPFKAGVQEKTISKKSGIVAVTFITYLLSSISLAVFLSFTTEMVDYEEFLRRDGYPEELKPYVREMIDEDKCIFDLRESFFDAVSGFTTTGLTAFRKTGVYTSDKREISKIDVQPRLIHMIRATYLWIGGLGIMFFYLYFTPVPSLMMSMGYEVPIERSLPRFIRLESFSFSLIYVFITALGILLLFLSISSTCQFDANDGRYPENVSNGNVVTYSVILAFSSISTGGFSPSSDSLDKLRIGVSYNLDNEERIAECHVNNLGLLILMFLMFAGAMPLFSLHRPLKFFTRWKMFAIFLFPVLIYGTISYLETPRTPDGQEISRDPEASFQRSLYRSFDAISAYTTTGLYTSQFEKDFKMLSGTERVSEYKKTSYISEYEKIEGTSEFMKTKYIYEYRKTEPRVADELEMVKKTYEYRIRSIYTIVLMFIGGAVYSTAGGWGFFNFYCVIFAFYLITNGKLEKVLVKYILGIVLSFLIFFSIFAIGTVLCYYSGLFGTISGPEPSAVADYVIDSAFYEISALSTVGLMPDSMIQSEGIYYNGLAYWTLAISMLIGRLYYIVFPLLAALITPEEGI